MFVLLWGKFQHSSIPRIPDPGNSSKKQKNIFAQPQNQPTGAPAKYVEDSKWIGVDLSENRLSTLMVYHHFSH